jgi:tetratricopeptide (TPR) repeat protein
MFTLNTPYMVTRSAIILLGLVSLTATLEGFRTSTPGNISSAPPAMCGSPSNKAVIKLIDTTRQIVPLFNGLGDHVMKVTSSSSDAKKFFNQGLNLYYGFNHLEAYRSFKEAARLDPGMAMAFWGLALSLGPNINAAMDPADASVVFAAITKAQSLKSKSTPVEQALIDALAKRYTDPAPADRSPLDKAYADAMKAVAEAHPADVDVVSLCTEALMDLHPWDYWKKDGTAQSWTPEITTMIDKAIALKTGHPGANHLAIHVYEASANPGKALPMADRLEALMPGVGHIVHMPSHIYIRTGRYRDGTENNERAIRIDEEYIRQCNATGIYPLMYYPHNIHFMWATTTLEGRSADAIAAADLLATKQDDKYLREPGWSVLQHYKLTPLYARVRFGKWDELLTMQCPVPDAPYPEAIWSYAKGIAMVRKGKISEADVELIRIQSLCKDQSLENERIGGLNSVLSVMRIAEKVLEGEIAAARKQYSIAVSALQQAIVLEDGLTYQEPYDWHQPVRQVLGAVLLEANQPAEAEKVLREDLQVFANNGWALAGLQLSLERQGRSKEAGKAAADQKKAFARADVRLSNSRL